jgi:hypothetical protein
MPTQKSSIETLRNIALSFPDTTEEPYFEKPSFRVHKKIFATVDLKNNRACVKLTITDQDLFSVFDKTIVCPVPNKWGQQGWTFVELQKVHADVLKDILEAAYCTVAPAKLVASFTRTKS